MSSKQQANNTKMATKEEFLEALHEWIELFDDFYTKKETPIKIRPLNVVMKIIENEYIRSEEDYSDIYETHLFKQLLVMTNEWYRENYGINSIGSSGNTISAVIFHRGTFLKLKINMSISVDNDDGETFDFILPVEVHESESIQDFLEENIKLQRKNRSDSENDIRQTVEDIRTIANNYRWAKTEGVSDSHLTNLSINNVSNAADSICDLDWIKTSNAIWLLSFSLEGLIKFRLSQLQISYPKTHDLRKLLETANQHSDVNINEDLIADLPTGGEAIKYRYGEMPEISKFEIYKIYRNYITAMRVISSTLDSGRITGRNVVFTAKKMKL